MPNRIVPRVVRGRLFWFIGEVGFATLKGAICARSALIEAGGAQ